MDKYVHTAFCYTASGQEHAWFYRYSFIHSRHNREQRGIQEISFSYYFYFHTYFFNAVTLMKSKRGRILLRARQIIVEGVIGEAKTWHPLGRCKYRGLENVKNSIIDNGICY